MNRKPRRRSRRLTEDTVSVPTAARLLGCSIRSVHYMLEQGRLKGTRFGKLGWWRISRASVDGAAQQARDNATFNGGWIQ